MFDLIFGAMTGLNQVATFAGALTFWGLGALLVGNAIYGRMHAVSVQGEVIGVRRDGNCLNASLRRLTAFIARALVIGEHHQPGSHGPLQRGAVG